MNEGKKIDLLNELKVDKELEKIWADRYGNDEVISGIFSNELYSQSITYLSLNPSLLPKDVQNAKKGNYPAKPYP